MSSRPAPADVETLLTGYSIVEGPCAGPGGELYFSDIYDGGVYRWWPDGRVDQVVPKRRAVGGIALHADGGLVISGRTVQHVATTGSAEPRTVLQDPTVRTFNDLGVDHLGRVLVGSVRDRYPDGSPVGGPGMVPEHRRRPYGELYRIGPDGYEVLYEFDGLSNGIAVSPDGARLYHVTSVEGIIVHDVSDGERLSGRRALVAPEESADGVAMDEEGCLWVAGGRGVRRIDPGGQVIDRIEVPTTRAISVCFGQADPRNLYVTTANSEGDRGAAIFRAGAPVTGMAVALATV
ncbi:MAG: SMP-30/gluconolactonase/LRE family protein [Acidimicrobiales bacterium]|nr:SMP-30/gluconolactonase/LRE family protein [Acidimicrobiales bacterium]